MFRGDFEPVTACTDRHVHASGALRTGLDRVHVFHQVHNIACESISGHLLVNSSILATARSLLDSAYLNRDN